MNTPESNSNHPNARLRKAVHSAEVPPFLEAAIRRRLENQKPRRAGFRFAVAAAVATFMLAVGLGIVYQLGRLRVTGESQESYIARLSSKLVSLMQVGLGDHIHCAFFRKFPATPPKVEELETSLGPEYRELATIVKRHVPSQYQVVLGHTCRYQKRPFVHLSMKGDSRLLSLIVTKKREGESFDVQGVLPELVQSGIALYRAGAEDFQIAAMETDGYLVYFISDLPTRQNMNLLQAMAPDIRTLLAQIEG